MLLNPETVNLCTIGGTFLVITKLHISWNVTYYGTLPPHIIARQHWSIVRWRRLFDFNLVYSLDLQLFFFAMQSFLLFSLNRWQWLTKDMLECWRFILIFKADVIDLLDLFFSLSWQHALFSTIYCCFGILRISHHCMAFSVIALQIYYIALHFVIFSSNE